VRLFLMRHYKTQINAERRIMGWGDSPPVEDWECDLVTVARALEEASLDARCIYTSELLRARATGEYLAGALGIRELISDAALNEVNYGDLYRRSKHWVANHVPEYKTDPDFVFPGGESFRQMQGRSVAFIEQLAGQRTGETLLMVAHAGVIRGLICHFLELPYAPNLKRSVSHRYIGEFRFDGDRCFDYCERGNPSEFVDQAVIQLPMHCPGQAR
jgi:broad specificity phosphatase PhoE